MKKLIIFLFRSITATAFSQQGWFHQNPLPTGNGLYDLSFIDVNTGWAVGDAGTILKTTDGGESWIQQNSGTKVKLTGVSFTDEYNGTAVGYIHLGRFGWPSESVIIRTTDGGNTWLLQYQIINENWEDPSTEFNSVFFINENNGWVVGNRGLILRTTNGGSSWELQKSEAQNDLYSIYFTDVNNGTAVGSSYAVLSTTDGGKIWVTKQIQSNSYEYTDVYFIDSNTGWILGWGDVILKTINGGIDWEIFPSPASGLAKNITFIDSLNGMMTGGLSLYKTTDGGNNWFQSYILNYASSAVCFRDLKNITAVGHEIITTSDGGQNWLSRSSSVTNKRLDDIFFINENEGWIAGDYGTLLRTTNGGEEWINQIAGTEKGLWGINFIDEYTGIVVGESGTILRTIDSGNSWTKQTSGTVSDLLALTFIEMNGWIVGESGTILSTTDGGQNWNPQESGTSFRFNDVFFRDINNGYAVGNNDYGNGIILKTTNRGEEWNTIYSGDNESSYLYGITFKDDYNGIAVGSYTILKTTDGGESWIAQKNLFY